METKIESHNLKDYVKLNIKRVIIESILYGFIGHIIIIILKYSLLTDVPSFCELVNLRTIAFSIAFGITVSLIWSTLDIFLGRVQDTHDLIKKEMEKVDNILKHAAVYGGKDFETIIGTMNSKHNLRWIVARFISEKIQKHFKDNVYNGIEIPDFNVGEYKNFLQKILNECSDRILWTCPYLPLDWFKSALEDNSIESFEDVKNKETENIDYQVFVNIFNMVKIKSKYRIVNLNKDDYAAISSQKNNPSDLLKHFIEVNKSENVKFYFFNLEALGIKYGIDKEILYDDFSYLKEDKNSIVFSWKVEKQVLMFKSDKDTTRIETFIKAIESELESNCSNLYISANEIK